MTQQDSGPIELTRLRSARAVISHLDRRERCRQFDIAAAIHEASADMPHLGDVDDDDSLFEDPGHEPEGCTSHPVTATAGLLQSLRTVAPVSGTKRRWGDYFELSGALQWLLPRCTPWNKRLAHVASRSKPWSMYCPLYTARRRKHLTASGRP